MSTCSKCPKPAKHHISVRRDEAEPESGKRDQRSLQIFRFCKDHWGEVRRLLPA